MRATSEKTLIDAQPQLFFTKRESTPCDLKLLHFLFECACISIPTHRLMACRRALTP